MNRRRLLSSAPIALILAALGIKPSAAATPKIVYTPVLYVSPETLTHTGFDGTLFMAEPLARTRDSLEFLLKAYTLEDGSRMLGKAYYKHIELSALETAIKGWKGAEVDTHIKDQFDAFIVDFYDGKITATPA